MVVKSSRNKIQWESFKHIHPDVYFNHLPVNSISVLRHLEMILDSKLNLKEHLKSALAKVNKTIGLIRKFQLHFPRNCLSTIGKSYVRSHLDYDEVIYDKAYNEFFYKKLNLVNIMQQLQSLVHLGIHHLRNSTKNQA